MNVIKYVVFFIYMTAAVSNADLLTDIVVHLPFNNSALDISGNGLHGNINGATLTTDRFGNANGAYHFNGIDNYISIGDNALFTVTDVSVATWVKTSDKSDMRHITSCYGTGVGAEWYNLYVTRDSGIARWQTDRGGFSSSVPKASGTTDIADGDWHFVVGTRTASGELKVYVDGVLEGTTIEPVPTELDPSVSFMIGGQNGWPARYFNGDIDDVRVYSRALSASEVSDLYAIPEPSTAILLSLSGVMLFSFRRKLFR